MLARFCAALGHLGRQQREVGCHQCAQAAALLPHHHQPRQQARSCYRRGGRKQAVEQLAHAQNAFAQLPQAKHQAHRNAVVFEMGIHRSGRGAASLQALAQALGCFVQAVGRAQRVHHLYAQAFHVADQRMKRLGRARRLAHAQAQLGREAS